MEFDVVAEALLGHLTPSQRQRLNALDAAYIELLSGGVPDKADVEALAEAVVAFYDGLAETGVGHENGA
jgi:Spy/CpxP family protein refolding chaperone